MNPILVNSAVVGAVTCAAGAVVACTTGMSKSKLMAVAPLVMAVATAVFMTVNASYGFMAAGAAAGALIGSSFSLTVGVNDRQGLSFLTGAGTLAGFYVGTILTLAASNRLAFGMGFDGAIIPIILIQS